MIKGSGYVAAAATQKLSNRPAAAGHYGPQTANSSRSVSIEPWAARMPPRLAALSAAISGKREQGGYVHHEEIIQPCFFDERWSGTEAPRPDSASEITLDKGELHTHLNGAVPATTVLEILADEGTEITTGFNPERDLVRRSPCSSLAEYLIPWQLLRRLPKREENLRRLVGAAVSNCCQSEADTRRKTGKGRLPVHASERSCTGLLAISPRRGR